MDPQSDPVAGGGELPNIIHVVEIYDFACVINLRVIEIRMGVIALQTVGAKRNPLIYVGLVKLHSLLSERVVARPSNEISTRNGLLRAGPRPLA